MEMASWSRASEHLVNLIGMSDQLKWNNHKESGKIEIMYLKHVILYFEVEIQTQMNPSIDYEI